MSEQFTTGDLILFISVFFAILGGVIGYLRYQRDRERDRDVIAKERQSMAISSHERHAKHESEIQNLKSEHALEIRLIKSKVDQIETTLSTMNHRMESVVNDMRGIVHTNTEAINRMTSFMERFMTKMMDIRTDDH